MRAPLVPVWPRAPLHMVAMDFLTLSRLMDRLLVNLGSNGSLHKVCVGNSDSGPDGYHHSQCPLEGSVSAIRVP